MNMYEKKIKGIKDWGFSSPRIFNQDSNINIIHLSFPVLVLGCSLMVLYPLSLSWGLKVNHISPNRPEKYSVCGGVCVCRGGQHSDWKTKLSTKNCLIIATEPPTALHPPHIYHIVWNLNEPLSLLSSLFQIPPKSSMNYKWAWRGLIIVQQKPVPNVPCVQTNTNFNGRDSFLCRVWICVYFT